MTVKATGAEYKAFMADLVFWPDDGKNYTWHEDDTTMIDSVVMGDLHTLSDILDTAKITIDGGMVFNNTWPDESEPSLDTYFKRWRKAQNTVFLAVEAPKDKLEAVKAAIKAAGGKVA